MENIHDPHNVSAIYRTCDAVGIPEISLLYTIEQFPKVSKISSASAAKWINTKKFKNTKKCLTSLKKNGFKIYATMLDSNAINMHEIDFTKKTAIILGNEHRGVSAEAAELADEKIFIPMRGMIQSLNVSVAAAVILYEAQRQRAAKGMYESSELNTKEIDRLIEEWGDR